LAYWFQRRRFSNIFPIGSYVKTMSTDGGHLGGKNILKSSPLKPVSQYSKHVIELRWSTSKIVFSDPDLGSKWPPSADIVLT
jgi:hypothetical protein